MKKQYILLIMILIILYILYLILSFTYKEYKINSNIEYIKYLNNSIRDKINEAEKNIEYKSSKAYQNKILKEQQSFKNKWEEVVFLVSEDIYNNYTQDIVEKKYIKISEKTIDIEKAIIEELSIYEKWKYFLFNKKD